MDYALPPVFVTAEAEMLPLAGEVNWGMDVLGIEYLRSLKPNPIKLGIVDTGTDPNHPLISANHMGSKSFVPGQSAYDGNGHGSHCTGTVCATDPRIGVASGFPYYHGKGLSNGGSGSTSGLINAIDYCLSNGCGIVSNSWGGGGPSSSDEREYRRMAESKAADGGPVWLIAAGGNSGPNTPDTDYPGRYPWFLNVAALNVNLTPASFSSAGDKIDTSGPGVNIWSARPGGGFAQMSGTSMATPYICGLLGLFRACLIDRGLPIPDVHGMRKLLFFRSTDTHTPGDDRRTGPGWATPALLESALTPPPMPVEEA